MQVAKLVLQMAVGTAPLLFSLATSSYQTVLAVVIITSVFGGPVYRSIVLAVLGWACWIGVQSLRLSRLCVAVLYRSCMRRARAAELRELRALL
jgi:hypothetical protein